MPYLKNMDSSFGMLREGYEYIQSRSRELGSDVFRGRLLRQPVVFLTGPDAAQLFYDTSKFRRADALPVWIQKTLFGEGGIQGLDDGAHRERKALFLDILSRESSQRFLELTERRFVEATRAWQKRRRVVLLAETQRLLCGAACEWAGVPMSARELDAFARDCVAMVDGFASLGPRWLSARAARVRSERVMRRTIRAVREGELYAELGSATQVFAERRQSSGERLPLEIAAVELLNVIRPITAIAWGVSFLALALRGRPDLRERLATDEAFVESFVHEVRRFYPFTPFVGARARHDLEWRGVEVKEGELVILDVYGTLRDGRAWDAPDLFLPERFLGRVPTPFDLIPNGGGDLATGHRCAGETLTIETLKLAARLLTRRISYDLAPQSFEYPLSRIPTAPRSGIVLTRVRAWADPIRCVLPSSSPLAALPGR